MKCCTRCDETKPLAAFYKRAALRDGHRSECKSCFTKPTPEQTRAAYQRTQRYKDGQARRLAAGRNQRGEGKDVAKLRARVTKRRAKLAEVVLAPFDQFVLEEAHRLRVLRNAATGLDWHVDHIVPVALGGASTADNIQVVPAQWNLSKQHRNTDRFIGY